jgi:hypothetical protein
MLHEKFSSAKSNDCDGKTNSLNKVEEEKPNCKDNASDNIETSEMKCTPSTAIIICVETVALIMCFVIICCQWKNTRKLPTNTLTNNSDNVESLYSNTQSNIPGQQEPELNYATLDLPTSNASQPRRNDRIIYSEIKR